VVVQKYTEITLLNEITPEGATHAMKTRTKEKNHKLYVKMFNLLEVANSTNERAFLQQVSLD